MAILYPGRGGRGGGSGLAGALGPEQNIFGTVTTADRAAAEALRDTYEAANTDWLALYNADRNFYILLKWDDGEQIQRRDVAGNDWEDVTRVAVGPRGPGPTDAQIQAEVKPFARVGGPVVPDAEIDADIARDIEIPDVTDFLDEAEVDARVVAGTKAFARTGGGQVPDTDIPAAIARDSEIPDTSNFITAAAVKEFALTGQRGVRAGDIDSQTATDNQVITADGSGGADWENQQGATPPVGMHLRYSAIRTADNAFTATDFESADAETSQTNTIDTPDTDDNAFLGFAIPDSVNDLSDIRQEGALFSYFGSFTLQAALVELGGEDHKVYASNFAIDAALIGGNWVLTPSI